MVRLAEVAELRARAFRRISWTALMLKAYSLVAADCPALRRAYVRWPWPHLVEMPGSVGMVAINRHDAARDEDRLCWGRFIEPQAQTLVGLQESLERYQTAPIEEAFRQQVQLSRLPLLLRRAIWGWNLNSAGPKRARRVGTFSLTTLAGQGACNRSHPTIHTTGLTYGPLDAAGQSLVTLICDHRVLDGVLAAQAIGELEAALNGPIARELAGLAARQAPAA